MGFSFEKTLFCDTVFAVRAHSIAVERFHGMEQVGVRLPVGPQMFLKNKTLIKCLVCLIFFVLFSTWIVLKIHTPKETSFYLSGNCPKQVTPTSSCVTTLDNSSIDKSIDSATRESHRLGKLSDIYLSVIRFDQRVNNYAQIKTTISTATTSNYFSKTVSAYTPCDFGHFNYGESKLIGNDFALTDATNTAAENATNLFKNCKPALLLNNIKEVPQIPPRSVLTFEPNPSFSITFSPDWWSWFLVFVFNVVLILGLLPLLREAYRFVTKGKDYFK